MVQLGINSVTGGTITTVSLLNVVDVPASADQIRIGAVVKAIFIELWILAGSQQPGSFTITVEKVVGDGTPMDFLQSALLHDYPNKKNILYTTQGVSPDANGNPVPILRQWIKIPKGKQRFGQGDALFMNLSANVEDMTFCGVNIYKEYY